MEAEEMHWEDNEQLGNCMQERGARARVRARTRMRAFWTAHGPLMRRPWTILE